MQQATGIGSAKGRLRDFSLSQSFLQPNLRPVFWSIFVVVRDAPAWHLLVACLSLVNNSVRSRTPFPSRKNVAHWTNLSCTNPANNPGISWIGHGSVPVACQLAGLFVGNDNLLLHINLHFFNTFVLYG
ncbi:hypothetical protein [Ruegeria sp. R14_0]|uniref:hypothetical protein n=1 Tax=Ruegeria sp. R14_0 TaxID=2821100 RepID=UPI001ADB2ABA|nr:hypothetical protein [Ruegeria sp. R14_0]MBO9446898.1 hypothetical protein [Ruegeria sp. R14_0]